MSHVLIVHKYCVARVRAFSSPGLFFINSNNSAACGDVLVAKRSMILIKIYFNAIEKRTKRIGPCLSSVVKEISRGEEHGEGENVR